MNNNNGNPEKLQLCFSFVLHCWNEFISLSRMGHFVQLRQTCSQEDKYVCASALDTGLMFQEVYEDRDLLELS